MSQRPPWLRFNRKKKYKGNRIYRKHILTRWLMIRAYKEERLPQNVFDMALIDTAGSNLWQDASAPSPWRWQGEDSSALTASHLHCWYGGLQGTKLPKCGSYLVCCLAPSETLAHSQQKWSITFPLLKRIQQFVPGSPCTHVSFNCYPPQIHTISLATVS